MIERWREKFRVWWDRCSTWRKPVSDPFPDAIKITIHVPPGTEYFTYTVGSGGGGGGSGNSWPYDDDSG